MSLEALILIGIGLVSLFLLMYISSHRKAEKQRIRRASTYQEPISGFESRKAVERLRRKVNTSNPKTSSTQSPKTRIPRNKVKEETSSESTLKRLSEPTTESFGEESTQEVVDNSIYSFLVVDDSKVARNFAKRALMNAFPKSEVILAIDGVDAWSKLEDITPDLIISDVDMPRVDGIEFKRRIRNDLRFSDIPVLLVSSRIAYYVKRIQDKPGLLGFLPKPYKNENLINQVEYLLDGGLF